MTANDRQRLKRLSILLVVLATTLWVGGQIRQTPEVLSVAGAEAGEAQALREDILSRSQLSMNRLNGSPDTTGEAGRRNLFEYGTEPPPPVPDSVPDDPGQVSAVGAGAQVSPPPQPPPPPPPPPPPIPFKYSGYAIVGLDSGRMQAFLFDNDKSFAVSEDEVLMGRYRVNEVTEAFVEVEDLEFGRRQRLPLIVE